MLSLVRVAGFFLLQDADLVAIVQIIVYASAIVVLFLFVIMLLGVDKRESFEEPQPAASGRWRSGSACCCRRGRRARGQPLGRRAQHSTRGALDDPAGGNVDNLASSLFTDFLWAFEITAVLLVIAVVGSVVARAGAASVEPGAGGASEVIGVDDHARATTSRSPRCSSRSARSACSSAATRS